MGVEAGLGSGLGVVPSISIPAPVAASSVAVFVLADSGPPIPARQPPEPSGRRRWACIVIAITEDASRSGPARRPGLPRASSQPIVPEAGEEEVV